MEPVLSLKGIEKFFVDNDERCHALSGVSFDVGANEIVCIMGPSGCGKSTILRIIDGLEKPDSGSISKNLRKDEETISSAMVFQEHALFPWLSVFDNIIYGLRLKAWDVPEEEAVSRVNSLLKLTRLEKFASSFPHQLSGGMKQRVSVARALAINPGILMMDEPFSALDPFTRKELQDEVIRIRKEMQTTILLVTHNPEEAVYLADRIIILSERPSSVSEIINIDLLHPRNPADPVFINLREKVSRMVQKRNSLPDDGN